MNFFKFTLILFIVTLIDYSSNEPIKIGFLADGLEEAKLAFKFAIKRVQEEKKIEKRIVGDVRKLKFGDVFSSYEATCTALKNGALAIIGPSSSESSHHVQSVCDTKEIPLIETHIGPPNTHAINLYPSAHDLARAYLDLINAWGWPGFTILYEDAPWLPVIDVIMRNFTDKFTVAVRQLDVTGNGNYRPRLLQVKHSGDKNVVICSSIEKLEEIFKQAQQVGLLGALHHVLITNLDMHTLDLEPYQYGGTNITGLRLINPNDDYVREVENFFSLKFSETKEADKNEEDEEEQDLTELPDELQGDKMRLQAALTYDAVMLFVKALEVVSKENSEILSQSPIDCQDPNSIFKSGTTLLNFMRTLEPFKGITGDIQFGVTGNRSNFNLDVLELVSDGLKKVGVWNSETGLESYHDRFMNSPKENDVFKGKNLIVLTVDNEPYGMRKQVSDPLIGNEQFEGYGIELIAKLGAKLGFNYTFVLQEDKKYGTKQADGSWNGMIGELMADRADLAITDLTITAEREEAVDFTMPFMDLGIQLLYEGPKKASPELLSFMEPLSINVWTSVGGAILLVSISFFIMGRMSPKEWDNPLPCVQEPTELQNQFTLKNSMWFTIGAILQEGSDVAPKAPSTRIVASIWWFFTLIMVSSYTANLASFLTVQKSSTLIEKVEDLVLRQDQGYPVKYGAKEGGSTISFFKEAKAIADNEDKEPSERTKLFARMYEYMVDNKDEVQMQENEDGVKKAKEGLYGFFMESSSIEYKTQRECEITAVGDKLDQKGYGIAMKKGSLFRGPLDEAILQLQESGELTRLKQKWWREKRGGGACEGKDSADAPKLTFAHVKGIFYVLFVGCGFGTTLGIIQWLINIKKIANYLQSPFGEVFKEEAKFVFQFSKNVKPSYVARKSSSQFETSMRSIRESNPSESRSRSNSNSVAHEPRITLGNIQKDNREDV